VISIRQRRIHSTRRGRDGPWSAIAAAALTGGSFAAVLLSMRLPNSWELSDAPRARDLATERVVFITSREAPFMVAPLVVLAIPSARTMPPSMPRTKNAITRARLDTGSTHPTTSAAPARVTESQLPFPSLSPSTLSPRLVPARSRGAPWYSLPRPRNPFAPPRRPSADEQDSTLSALSAQVIELAARRVPPQSERDAAAKEAMLKMRLSGRILLVPPDNSGGLITSSIPLPLFGAGSSRAKRARASRVFEKNRARLERLRQRADSSRRARGDSLPS